MAVHFLAERLHSDCLMVSNTSVREDSFNSSEIPLLRSVRLWILIILDTVSTLCSLLLLYHLIRQRSLRQALSNHVIIILLILGLGTQCIDVPLYIAFILNNGTVTPSVPAVCLVWWVVGFAMYNGGTILMAWAAAERHILVFNYRSTATRRGRLLAHYFPLLILLLYVFVFYTYALFFFPCENPYEYRLPTCNAYPCYQAHWFMGQWDFIMNNIVPSFIVAVLSVALLVRVVRQKRRLHLKTEWRKQRRMTIQLVSISALNVIFNVPLNLISLAHLVGLPEARGVEVEQYLYFFTYFVIFFFPFVCLSSYPKIYKRLSWKFLCRRCRSNTAVVPSIGQAWAADS